MEKMGKKRDTDVALVSCVKMKADRPMPAKDLYISPLFRGASHPAMACSGISDVSILLTPPKALRRKVAPDRSLPLSTAGSDAVPVVVSQPRDGLRL